MSFTFRSKLFGDGCPSRNMSEIPESGVKKNSPKCNLPVGVRTHRGRKVPKSPPHVGEMRRLTRLFQGTQASTALTGPSVTDHSGFL